MRLSEKNTPEETEMAKERIHWIDIAKGIAIICVFVGHTMSVPQVVRDFVYFFHMPAFFFLSGYCFSNRRKIGEFVLNKLKTVVLPIFTLGLGGSILVALMLQFVKHEAVDWKWTFLSPVVQYGEHSLLWYLAALFVAMLVFYGLTKLFKDKPAALIIVSFVLGFSSYCFIRFVGVALPWSIDTALVALPFVAAGYSFKKSGKSGQYGQVWIFVLSLGVCIASGVLNTVKFGNVEMHTNEYGNIVLFYISALAGCLMVCSVSMLIKENKVLEYFGRNSLIFYAFEPIQYFANFLLKTFGMLDADNPNKIMCSIASIAALAFILAASCALAAVVNKFFPFLIGKKKETKEIKS